MSEEKLSREEILSGFPKEAIGLMDSALGNEASAARLWKHAKTDGQI